MDEQKTAFAHFKKHDPVLYRAGMRVRATLVMRKDIRGEQKLFATLCESVVSQQLSVKASDTIWGRVKNVCGGKVTPDTISKASLQRLRKAGLSASKAKTLKEIARAVKKGLRFSPLKKEPPETATAALTKIWGVGPWTSEMFLMFGLNHPDIFSKGDLGLIRSIEALYEIKSPSAEKLDELSALWSPHRSLACRILWKSRDIKK